jgi:hypothetical protein
LLPQNVLVFSMYSKSSVKFRLERLKNYQTVLIISITVGYDYHEIETL